VNWNLIRKTISYRWQSTSIYSGSLAAYVLLMAAIFPSFKTMAGIQDFVKNYPKALMKFFGVQSFDVTSFNNYLVMELLSVMWVIIVGAYIISFAKGMVAGEMKSGTLELLLAQPIERWKVLMSEAFVLLLGIICVVLSTVFGVFVFGSAFSVGVTYTGYLAFIPVAIALFLSIAGYSILFSVVFNQPGRALMASAGLTLFFYVVHFAGAYWRIVEKIDWFGIFHYYDPLKVINSGNVPVKDVLILLAFAIVGFALAIWFFQRKDITVS